MHNYAGREYAQPAGRFPANLLLDEEAARQLDAQTGTLQSGMMKPGQHRNHSKGKGGYHGDFPDTVTANGTYGDFGGASRFFYCSKATKKEKGPGNDHPTRQAGGPDEVSLDTPVNAQRWRDLGPIRR
jgi:site-specific DNA-methyltransferase (adenine-specific)